MPWDRMRIANAVLSALTASREPTLIKPTTMANIVSRLVENELFERGETRVGIEAVQDLVELKLMTDADLPRTAKAYVLYREQRANERRKRHD